MRGARARGVRAGGVGAAGRGPRKYRDDPPLRPPPQVSRAKNMKKVKDMTPDERQAHPKRPTSAYFYFWKEFRKPTAEANPGVGIAALANILGAMWKDMPAAQKAPYEALASADRARYSAAKASAKAAAPSPSPPPPQPHFAPPPSVAPPPASFGFTLAGGAVASV